MPKRLAVKSDDTLTKERFKNLLLDFKFCSSYYRFRDNGDNMKTCHTYLYLRNLENLLFTPDDLSFHQNQKMAEVVSK